MERQRRVAYKHLISRIPGRYKRPIDRDLPTIELPFLILQETAWMQHSLAEIVKMLSGNGRELLSISRLVHLAIVILSSHHWRVHPVSAA
jgi:hypothetical protein